ncbi:hypothetical protein B0H13DRAFT_2322554 [Mycena leptocephala]|nr:hypothetical protein B0H13DRAFT_2322554 [Mycena leptocephala]
MSSVAPKLPRTNLAIEDLVMDNREKGKDSRYYCLPPYYGDPKRHRVGIFDSWLEAQASLTGFPDSAVRGYHSLAECIEAWQGFMRSGDPPPPIDPAFGGSQAPVRPLLQHPPPPNAVAGPSEDRAQEALLQSHPFPTTQPEQAGGAAQLEDEKYVNFAIRGGGIISSSAWGPKSCCTKTRPPGTGTHQPGKIGWVHGTKLTFFEGFKEQYLAAVELKETGPFYSRIAQKYLDKYGYNTPWEGDLEEGQDVADDVDLDEDVNNLTQEEGEERAEYYAKLRSKLVYGMTATRARPPPACQTRTLHYYSHRFYEERIKPRLVVRWAAVQRLPNPPAIVTLRNKVTRECWEAENDEFKAEVLAAREAEHQLAMDAYSSAVSTETPTTPEEYSVALNNAGYYLQPFADSAHERFGMNVVILLCGPVPDRGGRIEVRSIHAGKSNGLVPRIWADYDRAGFDATQRSFIEFSHHCFSKSDILLDDWKLNMECDLAEADCRARGLNGMGMEGQDEAPASSSSNETPSSSSETPTSTSANETPSSSSSSDSPTPPLSSSPQMPQWSQPESGSLPPLRPLRDSLRYDPLDPAFDGLISMDFGPEAGMGDGLHAGIGDNFNFDFGGGFGGLGSVFGDGGAEFFGPDPERNGGDNLPPLNLTNREDDEEEALGDKSPSSSPAGDKSASSAPSASPSPARDAAPPASSPPPALHQRRLLLPPALHQRRLPLYTALHQRRRLPLHAALHQRRRLPRQRLPPCLCLGPNLRQRIAGQGPPHRQHGKMSRARRKVAANRVWEEQETDRWPEELQKAFAGFARGKSWGGERWERCVL